jgi:hypothetical protein
MVEDLCYAGSSPDEVPEFVFQFNPSFQQHHHIRDYPASSRNEYQKNLSGYKGRPTRKAYNFTANCERLFRQCGIRDISNHIGLHGMLRGEL